MMLSGVSPANLVHQFLENSADRYPEKVALVCDGQRVTYREMESQSNRLANALIENGIRRGDRVALFLHNSVELVTGIFATLKAGAVFVIINPTTKPEKLDYILNNCQAAALFTWPARSDLVKPLLETIPSLKFVVLSDGTPDIFEGQRLLSYPQIQAVYQDSRPDTPSIDLDLACLIYTSGSTGDPKGVMSDHSNIVFAVRSITTYLENQPEDVVINVLPLSFDYGLYQVFMTFGFGGRLVLEKGFSYPAHILKQMEQEKVTGFPGVPTIFSMLMPMDLSAYNLSSLRYITNTAAALPVSHIQQLVEKFPQVRLFSMYGLTETKRTLYLPPEELKNRPGSVGIAIPGTEVWLEDENGLHLGPNQTGEMVVRGRHVMRGYWGDPKATAERFRLDPVTGDRLCYTGDLFRMDEEGYFYFIARKDDIIKSRGEKVAPKELEGVLYRMEGVRQAAVIGIPDPILGQAIKAFIVHDGRAMTERDVLRHCRANLEDYMIPKQVEFRAALPMTASGKIKKTDLI